MLSPPFPRRTRLAAKNPGVYPFYGMADSSFLEGLYFLLFHNVTLFWQLTGRKGKFSMTIERNNGETFAAGRTGGK
jgi:hypothetical protein